MKASVLVQALNKLIEKHGDLHVIGRQDGFGGYAMHLVDKPSTHLRTISLEDFEEEPEAHILKELFPDLKAPEGVFDEDGNIQVPDGAKVRCIELSFGSMIYST